MDQSAQSRDPSTAWLKVAERVSGKVGHDFLGALVVALRDCIEASLVFISARDPLDPSRVRAIYALQDGEPIESFAYELEGVPCTAVYEGRPTLIPCDLAERFPKEAGFEGYVGVPLHGMDGAVEGHLAVISRAPIEKTGNSMAIARIFGLRIESERRRAAMERQRDAMIADLARLNERLRRRYISVHEANAFKTRLLGVIAHDLRNPLAAVMAQAELIETLAGRPDPSLQKIGAAGAKVVASAERMAGLIDATLTRVREDMTRLEVERAETDLVALVRLAIEANAAAAAEKSIAFHWSPSPGLAVRVDEELMLEAIDNLVSNAVKYSYPGGQVRIDLHSDETAARIRVADRGQGLTEADMGRVFGRFETLSAKPTAGESATGLGLANVKEIVEAHGGAVRAESPGRDQGAVFTIELPLAPA